MAVIKNFVGLWINDSDCFIGIHDRKLSVLGLCRLITLVPQNQQTATPWQEYVPQIMPSLIMLFKGLKSAYECRKEAEEDEDSSDEEDEESDLDENDALDSDEDEIDEESSMYLESLQDKISKHTNGNIKVSIEDDEDEDSDDDCDIFDEASLENYTTPIDDEDNGMDEYQIFEETFKALQASNIDWYNQLTSSMSAEQQKAVQEIVVLANQRKAARQSKSIQMSGGYQFNQATVPSQFDFGSTGNNFSFGGGKPQ